MGVVGNWRNIQMHARTKQTALAAVATPEPHPTADQSRSNQSWMMPRASLQRKRRAVRVLPRDEPKILLPYVNSPPKEGHVDLGADAARLKYYRGNLPEA